MNDKAPGIWREGKRLVMDRAARLPDRCVKCNEDALGYRRKVKLSYAPRTASLLIGEFSVLLAKQATIEIPLCPRHRGQRGRAFNALLLAAAGIVAGAYLAGAHQPGAGTALILAGLAAVVYAIWSLYLVRATKMDDVHVWIAGCGEPFLASLPLERSELSAGAVAPPDPAEVSREAYVAARNGALAFAAGSVITAGSYLVAPGGRYYIVWGIVLLGLIQLVRGVRGYLQAGAAWRRGMQVVTLATLVLTGVVALGWVGASEARGSEWDAAVDRAADSLDAGEKLFAEVVARPGSWTAEDAADMARVAGYYGEAADALAGANPPSELVWYRNGMVTNLRDGQDIATQLSKLTAASPSAAFDALGRRWSTRVTDFNQLQDRLRKQSGR